VPAVWIELRIPENLGGPAGKTPMIDSLLDDNGILAVIDGVDGALLRERCG
jgi:hypothetical protein